MAEPSRRALVALTILTLVTGIVDAASVLGLGHVFTANMTGNVVFLGFALAGTGAGTIAASLVALGSFLCGAAAGGRIARVITARALRLGFGLSVAGLAIASGLAATAWPEGIYLVVAMLAFAMGLRNAMIRSLGIADMTTTVLTLTLTGLAADSSLAGGSNPRWKRRVSAVIAMLLGAVLGAVLLGHSTALTVATAAVLEAVAGMVLLGLSRRGLLG